MKLTSYIDLLNKKFARQARAWPKVKRELEATRTTFIAALETLLYREPDEARNAIRQASEAQFVLTKAVARHYRTNRSGPVIAASLWLGRILQRPIFERMAGVKRLLGKAVVVNTDVMKIPFLDNTSRYLTALLKFSAFDSIKPLGQTQDLPAGNVLMYSADTFVKLLSVDENGDILSKSLRNKSGNESRFRFQKGALVVADAKGKPTTHMVALAETGDCRTYIGFYDKNPFTLHSFVVGEPADAMADAASRIERLKPSPQVAGVRPPAVQGTPIHAIEKRSGRRVAISKLSAGQIFATASHAGWVFSREFSLLDVLARLPKSPFMVDEGADLSASLAAPLRFRSCIVLEGYVTLYHYQNAEHDDIFVLEGFASVAIFSRSLLIGRLDKFRSRTDVYIDHFISDDDRNGEDWSRQVFYEVACSLFRTAPQLEQGDDLTLGYGNWRVGDCLFALAAIRQMGELGFPVKLLSSDAQLLSLGLAPSDERLDFLKKAEPTSAGGLSFHAGYTDGISNLLGGTMGFSLGQRFPCQQRGRAFGKSWQSAVYPAFKSGKVSLLSDKVRMPPVADDRPFGVFFSLDLEKRSWLEQQEFIEKFAVWCNTQPYDIRIFINGMTSYEYPHGMGLATALTMIREEDIVKRLEDRIVAKIPGFRFSSIAEFSLARKCENIRDHIDFVIGPFGSGTVVPSFLFNKPGLIYSSNAMYRNVRDVLRSVDELAGSQSVMVPLEWVRDADARDHRFFPVSAMTNYSIDVDRVLELATAGVAYCAERKSIVRPVA